MAVYITIDGGTTNTRISLAVDCKITDTVKIARGASSVTDDREGYKNAVKDGINTLLYRNGLASCDICKILASGMITSELGLCALPHITVPAGIKELHESIHEVNMPDISDINIVFIRGVKTACTDLESADMMRGEESEIMGIISDEYGESVYVLPGSHSKHIYTDKYGRITDFTTMLTGEMIAALSQNTVLKNAFDLSVTEINEEYLLYGCDYCLKNGMNEALFKARVLKNIFGCEKDKIYSFFLGTVLCDEIERLIKCKASTVVIGGRAQIKNATALILRKRCDKNIVVLSENEVESFTSLGMIKIYEYKE